MLRTRWSSSDNLCHRSVRGRFTTQPLRAVEQKTTARKVWSGPLWTFEKPVVQPRDERVTLPNYYHFSKGSGVPFLPPKWSSKYSDVPFFNLKWSSKGSGVPFLPQKIFKRLRSYPKIILKSSSVPFLPQMIFKRPWWYLYLLMILKRFWCTFLNSWSSSGSNVPFYPKWSSIGYSDKQMIVKVNCVLFFLLFQGWYSNQNPGLGCGL